MTNRAGEFSPKQLARIAGFLYLVVIVGGAFAEIFVRQRFVVDSDAVATANNILSHEQVYRWGFVADLIACLCNVPLAMIFYELFKVVNRRGALLVVYFTLVGTAIQVTALFNHFEPLILLKRGQDLGVNLQLLQAQAYMALRLQSTGYAVALTFFGCYCLVMGYLIFQSTFLPRIIGLLLVIEGACYLTNSFVVFLAPEIANRIFGFLLASGMAEVILCLWLLVMGVNVQKRNEKAGLAVSGF